MGGWTECVIFFLILFLVLSRYFLGRSWRREFGEGSEWGRKGMFRIIGMEQFASGLVESA